MTSDRTTAGGDDREGQDHDETEVPTLADIRFQRLMRLLCGLAVPVVAVVGAYRIAEAGGDPLEVVATVVAVATVALFSAFAGAQATQLQTAYDEATAPSDHD